MKYIYVFILPIILFRCVGIKYTDKTSQSNHYNLIQKKNQGNNESSIDLNDLTNKKNADRFIKRLAWIYKEQVLHPNCFKTEWISSDNVKEYYERFIGDEVEWEDFSKNLGKYWGKNIKVYDPILASWGEEIELAVSMKNCLNNKTKNFELDNKGWITSSEDRNSDEYAYSLVAKVPLNDCQNLAPHLPGRCVQSNLIQIREWRGGSLTWKSYGIYAVFLMQDGKEYIFPLKRFESENDINIK
tara:strand:- start:637 stop:1365 length:729 start_codon:yes stop_codon:yes gene_type:complete